MSYVKHIGDDRLFSLIPLFFSRISDLDLNITKPIGTCIICIRQKKASLSLSDIFERKCM